MNRNIAILILTLPLGSLHSFNDFPEINQREIAGVEDRCGTIALGSTLLWLGKNDFPELLSTKDPILNCPFSQTDLEATEIATLSNLNHQLGGTKEIQLYQLIQGLVRYFHSEETEALSLNLYYYNLPEEDLLKRLVDHRKAVILFHGVYKEDPQTKQLERAYGHYSCLTGLSDDRLVANTYGKNYTFTLDPLPMRKLSPKSRYQPTSIQSYIYLKCNPEDFPRYRFTSFAANNKEFTQLQRNEAGQLFAYPDETILLEGALVIDISRDGSSENSR
ncbi:MAG: hypothetical protein ACON4O_07165 [Lentimonas sp.]